MENYNRQDHLQQLHQQRKDTTRQKAESALMRLVKSGGAINFNSVARESGLTKATLYNNTDIRQSIEQLRMQQARLPSPGQVKREMSDCNKDAVIASLKRKLQRLEQENTELRKQVKINYAELYEKL